MEYIQDIAFNDICDKMAISTTSQKIIIYQKIQKKSNDLITLDKEIKEEINNKKKVKSPLKDSHRAKIVKNKSEKKKRKSVDRAHLNDSVEIRGKQASSRSLISMESSDSTNRKHKDVRSNDDDENNNDFYFFSRESNNNLFKSINFDSKKHLKFEKFNHSISNNDDSLDSLSNSPYLLKYTKNKEYEYRWEKVSCLTIDGPALRLQWANSVFGNIVACSAYNKCVYLIKEEKDENYSKWIMSAQIKQFTDIVEDISFVPRNNILELATITSDGFLKTFWPMANSNNWELNHLLNISKSGCTCLCCNPSNLDNLTIVVGCKKKLLIDEIKAEKNNIKEEQKILPKIKKQDSTNKNQANDLIKIIYFKDNNSAIIGVISGGHEDDITDVDWANQNGRLHHMICSTSKDGKFIIWEINLLPDEILQVNDGSKINNNFFSYKILYKFEQSKPLWRCSFNESGVLVSFVDEDGEIFVFLKTGRDKFMKLDINKQK